MWRVNICWKRSSFLLAWGSPHLPSWGDSSGHPLGDRQVCLHRESRSQPLGISQQQPQTMTQSFCARATSAFRATSVLFQRISGEEEEAGLALLSYLDLNWWTWVAHRLVCARVCVCCCCSVAQLCLTLCDPMGCSIPGLPVPHCLPEFAQVHVLCITDAIQPSHPLMPSSPSALSFFPASGSFPMSQLFTSDDQNTRVSASASVLPMNIQGWCPLRLTHWISLLSRGLLGVFSGIMVWRHQFFGALPSLWSSSHNRPRPLGRRQPWLYRPLWACA